MKKDNRSAGIPNVRARFMHLLALGIALMLAFQLTYAPVLSVSAVESEDAEIGAGTPTATLSGAVAHPAELRVGIVHTQSAADTRDYLSGTPLNTYYTFRVNQVKDLLQSEGFEVAYVDGTALSSRAALRQFDVLVFTMTLATTPAQRSAILAYASEGGGIVGSFGFSHWNENPAYTYGYWPFLGMHAAPGIYTWPPSTSALKVWEWGEISEIFNVSFRNDPLMRGPYELRPDGRHWILSNGFSSAESRLLVDKPDRYNEVLYTLPGAKNVTPLYRYYTLDNGNPADDAETGHLAAWTSEYYFGRFVYFGFHMHDLINEGMAADARTASVARRVLSNSVRWAGTRTSYTHLRKGVELSGRAWYTRGTLYIDETAKNIGGTSLRGPLRIQVRNPSGSLVYSGQAYDNLCPLPPGESYTHKSYTVPLPVPQQGTWSIRMSYQYFDYFRNGWVGAERTVLVDSNGSAMSNSRLGPQTLVGAGNRSTVGSRIAGNNRYGTSAELSQHGWPDGISDSETVVLATGSQFADALAAAPLAGNLDAPVLLVPPSKLGADVAAELTRLFRGRTKASLIVVGGERAVSPDVVTAARKTLTEAGVTNITVERLYGSDRYGTAAAIAERVGVPESGAFAHTAFIVSGENYPDALAMSALAAAEGVPLLPVRRNSVPADIEAALKSLGVKHVTVAGGHSVVSAGVETWLETRGYRMPGIADNAMNVDTRLAGTSRYVTALEAGRYAVELGGFDTGSIYFATGRNWPDALALSPVAGKERASLVLVHGAEMGSSSAVADYLMGRRENPPVTTFIGGSAAVSDYVRGQIRIALGL